MCNGNKLAEQSFNTYFNIVPCPAGLTPLAAACIQGKEELAEILLEHSCATVNIADNKKFLPLHYVARAGKLTLVRKLLDAGMATIYILQMQQLCNMITQIS